jgi:hypothetical protein
MKTSGTRTFAILFGVLGVASLVCSVLAGIHTHRVNVAFERNLYMTRGLGEGYIDMMPPLGREREAELRKAAAQLEQDRDAFTLPYWIPAVVLVLSALVCGGAIGLWIQGNQQTDANKTFEAGIPSTPRAQG